MLRIGCHLSSAKGFLSMAQTADSIGANTFQFFTRNPRGGAAKEWKPEDVEEMLMFAAKKDISHFLAHAPYTLNACGKDDKVRRFALETMKDDLKRLEMLPGCMYNFHPGSHVQQGARKGIELITDALNHVLTKEQDDDIKKYLFMHRELEKGKQEKNGEGNYLLWVSIGNIHQTNLMN